MGTAQVKGTMWRLRGDVGRKERKPAAAAWLVSTDPKSSDLSWPVLVTVNPSSASVSSSTKWAQPLNHIGVLPALPPGTSDLASLRLGLAPLHSGASEGCGEHTWEEVTARTVSCEERALHGWRLSGAREHWDGSGISTAPHPQGLVQPEAGAPGACTAGRKGGSAWAGHWVWAGHSPGPAPSSSVLALQRSEALRFADTRSASQPCSALRSPGRGSQWSFVPGLLEGPHSGIHRGSGSGCVPRREQRPKQRMLQVLKGLGENRSACLLRWQGGTHQQHPWHQEIPQKVAGPRAAMGGRCLRRRAEAGGPRRT